MRGGRREFLYSRLMAWVAVDRAVRLSLKRSFPAPLERWLRVRDEIYTDIYRNFWNTDLRFSCNTKEHRPSTPPLY